MKTRLLHDGHAGQPKTFVLVFDTGDEVMSGLREFARQERLSASHFSGIGAFQSVTLGYFHWERKAYEHIPLNEQVEVLSMTGTITHSADAHTVHAHVVLGKADGTAHGGHLMEGRVRPTLEVVLTESPHHLQRSTDPKSGLALIVP